MIIATIFVSLFIYLFHRWAYKFYLTECCMQADLKLLPKRPSRLKENAFQRKESFITNHYRILMKKTTELYQFVFDTDPVLPDDSIPVLRELIISIKNELIKAIGLVSHKGKILWGIKPLSKPLVLQGKVKQHVFEMIIKPTRVFNQFDIAKLQGKALKEVLQVYNLILKEKIVGMGLKQVTKGRFFRLKTRPDQENIMQDINLQVLRTYEMRLVPLMNGVSLQLDTSSRILRLENFLQTLSRAKSIDERQLYVGCIVQSNYGNRSSYKIVSIDYSQSPLSQFYQEKNQEKVTYQRYYFENYQIKIKELKQPLIEVVLKVTYQFKQGKKIRHQKKGFLIPELVRLVGIPDKIKTDHKAMRRIADFTKINPMKRFELSEDLIDEFNQVKGEFVIDKVINMEGYVLPNPAFITSFEQRSQNGALNFKDRLKQPMKLKKHNWIFAYSNLSRDSQQDDDDADSLLEGFRTAQQTFGIKIEEPIFAIIEKDHIQEWKNSIRKIFKDDVIVVLFFTNRESRYYGQLKRFLTNEIKVASQAVLRKALQNKGLSVYSKIICQINAKIGKALWSIPPKHPFWKERSFAYGGLSLSKGKDGHTIAFVGTYSQDMTKTYGISLTKLPSRENIPEKLYEDMLSEWLKRYYEYQNHFPSILILYRQGLSTQQANIQGQKQLSALFTVIQRANKKVPGYNPQIIYIIVNKRVSSRFYTQKSEGHRSGKFRPSIENPSPGSVIFEPLSTENAYDFHLAAQKVTQGTTTPTHYRIAYDSSQIPQDAIAQFTYEQCYNYPNWFGAVRVPSCLQSANKLSRLTGQHLRQDPTPSELLKTPFYL